MAGFKFKTQPVNVPKVLTKFRKIKTAIPTPGTNKILKKLDSFESRSMHGQLPIVWDKAKNASVYDVAGNKWIDFTSGIFVTNVGHSNEKVSQAIKDTMLNDMYSCYVTLTKCERNT